MRASAQLAERHGVLLHTHLAETRDEAAFCQDMFAMTPLDYLEDCGWLGPRTWLAHGIHFAPDEIQRLAAAGTAILSLAPPEVSRQACHPAVLPIGLALLFCFEPWKRPAKR